MGSAPTEKEFLDPKLAKTSGLPDLRAMSLEQLEALMAEQNQPGYRAKQVYRWLHQRGAETFEQMSDLPKGLRSQLAEHARISKLIIERAERAKDGTRKYAMRASAGDVVESVFIPDASAQGRNTLCISSQVGCAIDCKFCLTASLGLLRNLNAGEIVEQILRVQEDLQQHPGDGPAPKIGNIVMMGMGEPLQNYRALVQALTIMSSELGPHISPRRITVSTAGLVPRIPRLGEDTSVNLAVSLNATTDAVRDQIMPINKRWNIRELLDACKRFPLPARRRITFEYVLLKDVNDSDADAKRLVKLLKPIRCKVNLIPFNEHPYSPYTRPTAQRVERFQALVRQGGLTVLVRTPRGDDISAACGQLGAEVEAPRRSLRVLQESEA